MAMMMIAIYILDRNVLKEVRLLATVSIHCASLPPIALPYHLSVLSLVSGTHLVRVAVVVMIVAFGLCPLIVIPALSLVVPDVTMMDNVLMVIDVNQMRVFNA